MSKNTRPLLHIELAESGYNMRFQIYGDPVIVTDMISQAMEANQEIAAAMIAAVTKYCISEGFDPGDLKKMVKFE